MCIRDSCIGSRSSRKRNHSAPEGRRPRTRKALRAAGAAERAGLVCHRSLCRRSGAHKAIRLQQRHARRWSKRAPAARGAQAAPRRRTGSSKHGGSVSALLWRVTRISGKERMQRKAVLLNGSFSSTAFASEGPDAQKAEADQKRRQSPGD